ncbi:MAG: FIG00620722: hypothetical protein [uncultured Cytophagales bacterium]|uniref:Uncharacterized protein n=1 Tax=uncultured Cytophagales bacterium TaxID=158755 RepID=A0A6J4LUD5_9SPHI|nr:MAG: FIG00620722: hypothetical protein [uncultured Cytophagales bacterium]
MPTHSDFARLRRLLGPAALWLTLSCAPHEPQQAGRPVSLSGVYPHLAYYNDEGECGTGAVVPWAGRLWVVTYGPHLPNGSSDKLYEITPDLQPVVRPESTGGTPANRMIHRESNQLFIGPYAVDAQRNVRVIPYRAAPGRYTGVARHLTDPAGKVYVATMEEGFYEVDVKTLGTRTLYPDANGRHPDEEISVSQPGSLLPGAHGKGVYAGQGALVYSNNGEASPEALRQFDIESGALAEWNGKDWKVVRRSQFVEVTGPGGLYGNPNPATDPIWATGWDHKSVVVGVRDGGTWSFYRLPKASHSYDGAHGWNTEWPRIRDVGPAGKPDYLMTMHGMFWRFPGTFSAARSGGIRPRSAYLKVIGDFARWNDGLVFGCDDSAQKEFLNKRKVKGDIEGPGQSNSNLWFTPAGLPDQLGPTTAEGAVWLAEPVPAGGTSEPFLFAGWPRRSAWIKNDGRAKVDFSFQADARGTGNWQALRTVSVEPGGAVQVAFSPAEIGEWVRVVAGAPTVATVHFSYAGEEKRPAADGMFRGLAEVTDPRAVGGLLYGLGDNRRALGIAVQHLDGTGAAPVGYYELDANLRLAPKNDPETLAFINGKFAIPQNVVTVDASSVLVVDDRGRRWRLPLGPEAFAGQVQSGMARVAREVATERDLFHCMGTFYELPAENADGFAKIRPVSSHGFRIHDYASYRGLLVMTGIDPAAAAGNPHVIVSEDGKAAVWAGVIDDLWKLGKPTGRGGPWKNTAVKANEPSDPYLIGFYEERTLALSHAGKQPVTFRVEAEPVGHGPWMLYREITVAPGQTVDFAFPDTFQARWVRFVADAPTVATAWLTYR